MLFQIFQESQFLLPPFRSIFFRKIKFFVKIQNEYFNLYSKGAPIVICPNSIGQYFLKMLHPSGPHGCCSKLNIYAKIACSRNPLITENSADSDAFLYMQFLLYLVILSQPLNITSSMSCQASIACNQLIAVACEILGKTSKYCALSNC